MSPRIGQLETWCFWSRLPPANSKDQQRANTAGYTIEQLDTRLELAHHGVGIWNAWRYAHIPKSHTCADVKVRLTVPVRRRRALLSLLAGSHGLLRRQHLHRG